MSTPVLDRDRENGSQRWYAYWTDGRRSRRKSMGTTDPADAKRRFAQWLLLGGDEAPAKNAAPKPEAPEALRAAVTVADLWDFYLRRHVSRLTDASETGESKAEARARYVWNNLKPHFGTSVLSVITQDTIDSYRDARRTGWIGQPAKDPTVRRELAILRAAINFCAHPRHRPRIIESGDVPLFDLPEGGQPRDRWLTMVEMQRLLFAAAKLRQGPRLSRGERFLWIALETAARKEAILELTWDRVDFETGTIHFDVPGRRQTKKRRAVVAISTSLRPVLERAYAERVVPKLAPDETVAKPILVMDHGADVWATVQLIAEAAGFGTPGNRTEAGKPRATGISPHVLRHTAATHMARRGVPLWKIAKTLGNTLTMTEKVYAKWCPDDPQSTVDLISGGMLRAPAEFSASKLLVLSVDDVSQ